MKRTDCLLIFFWLKHGCNWSSNFALFLTKRCEKKDVMLDDIWFLPQNWSRSPRNPRSRIGSGSYHISFRKLVCLQTKMKLVWWIRVTANMYLTWSAMRDFRDGNDCFLNSASKWDINNFENLEVCWHEHLRTRNKWIHTLVHPAARLSEVSDFRPVWWVKHILRALL